MPFYLFEKGKRIVTAASKKGELGVGLGTVGACACGVGDGERVVATLFSRCTPLNSEANIFLIVSSRYFRIRSA